MNALKTIFAVIAAFFGFQNAEAATKAVETKSEPAVSPKPFSFVEMVTIAPAFHVSQLKCGKTVRITGKPANHNRMARDAVFIRPSKRVGWSVLQSASGEYYSRRTSDILGFM